MCISPLETATRGQEFVLDGEAYPEAVQWAASLIAGRGRGHPKLRGPERVVVVGCKSWQRGFNPAGWINAIDRDMVVSGRKAWQAFRELIKPKWAGTFRWSLRVAAYALLLTTDRYPPFSLSA